nr:NADH dehydrogenase subunit 5 [Cylindrocystis brebissonii]
MQSIYQYVWLVPLLPCLSSIILGLGLLSFNNSIRNERLFSFYLSTSFLTIAMLLSFFIFWEQVSSSLAHRQLWTWIQVGNVSLDIGYFIDPLSSIMLILVTSVGVLVMIYTRGYMSHDQSYVRFYAYLSLFTSSMLGLVLSPNLVQIYFFWELVGMCSYLLIGFWFSRPNAAYACQKAFVTNRIGDFGLLLGILGFYWLTNSLDFDIIGERTHEILINNSIDKNLIILFCFLLLSGPIAKSAQFPLHVWLPDAMEGPTPISALIHAATMVAAGVFLIARLLCVFQEIPLVMDGIAWIGCITALLGATIALAQKDLKKGLAYSTMSQLGYMILALGLGSYQAGLFHLITHAYSKALLFLGSGSVIHGVETIVGYDPNKNQNMIYMGGLRTYMPITGSTFLIGTLSLCGIPPFACFWSKDEILADAWEKFPLLGWIAWITAGLTAFYMFRMYFLTFEGDFRGSLIKQNEDKPTKQISTNNGLISINKLIQKDSSEKLKNKYPHESSTSMVLPLILLTIPTSLIGLLGAPLFSTEPERSLLSHWFYLDNQNLTTLVSTNWFDYLISTVPSVTIGLIGTSLAWLLYGPQVERLKKTDFYLDPVSEGWGNFLLEIIYKWSLRRAYIDDIYDKTFVWFTRIFAQKISLIDEWAIDGIVNASGLLSLLGGESTRYVETGRTPAYIFLITFVLVLLLSVVVSIGLFHF